MPTGYTGAPAIRYFSFCEELLGEAHGEIISISRELPTIQMPDLRQLPYTSADATFTSGLVAQVGNSTNIAASGEAYSSVASENRLFASDISDRLRLMIGRINNVLETDLCLPHTSAQVELVATKLGLLVPELKGILEKVADVTIRQSASMLSIAGGGPGLVMFGPLAESYRLEMETCLRGVVLDYRDYAQQARAAADEFDRRADELVPELSATRQIETTTVGRPRITALVDVPDQARRDLAAAQIASFRCDARIYRAEAVRIDGVASNIEEGIRYSFAIFETDCNECINCDTYYAGEFARLADEMRQLAGKIKDIYNSFCPSAGITNFDALLGVKSGMSQANQDKLFGLMVNAMVAQMMGDGDVNWDMIDEMLGRNIYDISPVELAALAQFYFAIPNDADVEKFLSLGYRLNLSIYPPRLELTDTMLATAIVIESIVMGRALETIWAHPAVECGDIRNMVERLQILETVITSASSIAWESNSEISLNTLPTRTQLVQLNRGNDGSLEVETTRTVFAQRVTQFTGTEPPSVNIHHTTDSTRLDDFDVRMALVRGEDIRGTLRDNRLSSEISAARNDLITDAAATTVGLLAAKMPAVGIGFAGLNIVERWITYSNIMDDVTARRTKDLLTEGFSNLYAKVNYTIVNGEVVIHAVQFDTAAGRDLTNAFMNHANDTFNFELSVDDFRLVILNGRPPDGSLGMCDTWSYLPHEVTDETPEVLVNLTPDQQARVHEAFRDFTCGNTGFWTQQGDGYE